SGQRGDCGGCGEENDGHLVGGGHEPAPIAAAVPTHTPRFARQIRDACASPARISARPRGARAMLKNEQRIRRTLTPMKPRITLTSLGVDDLERSLAFYRDGLGLATEGITGTQFEHGAVVFFDLAGGCKLALWPRASLAHDTGLAIGPPGA